MKISVVIPNLDGGAFLGECLESVLSQDCADKEIIVMDGGSTDLSLRIVREFERRLSHWESTPDGGPYHAVERGLNRASGDVLCWLNSDDILLPGALKEVDGLFSGDPGIQWLTGMHATFLEPAVLRERGYPATDFFLSDDTRYAVQLFRNTEHIDWTLDYILEKAPRGGYFLQQESTFWRRELWSAVGGFDHRYKLAGDYWLWLRFLEKAPLVLVDRPFGCFRQSAGQRSSDHAERYQAEAVAIATRAAAGNLTGEAGPLIQVRKRVRDGLVLATSIAPVDVQKQAFCMKSWRTQGCRILSFNTPEEIDEIRSGDHDSLEDVEFVPVKETARATAGKDLVLLRDVIAHYQDLAPEVVLGIVNSDIMIEPHVDLLSLGREGCGDGGCVISSRVDVEEFWDREGQVFAGGFDVFLFRSPHIRDYPMESEFAIGAPWWDYFLAHALRGSTERVRYPRPIPFYHKRHTTNYPPAIWARYGKHFLDHFDPELAGHMAETPGTGYQIEFLARVARQFTGEFYRACESWSPIEWASLPPWGNAYHSRSELLQKRIRSWAHRAILAEELLQGRAGK